jgi:hypothetical protein
MGAAGTDRGFHALAMVRTERPATSKIFNFSQNILLTVMTSIGLPLFAHFFEATSGDTTL